MKTDQRYFNEIVSKFAQALGMMVRDELKACIDIFKRALKIGYIQAKQWSADHKVSRPEVQKFAGALQGEKATKGLFITTTEFTKDAQAFAANLLSSNIILIDGNQLTKLMIKHNLGVAVEQTYEIKRIDSDFFSEDL